MKPLDDSKTSYLSERSQGTLHLLLCPLFIQVLPLNRGEEVSQKLHRGLEILHHGWRRSAGCEGLIRATARRGTRLGASAWRLPNLHCYRQNFLKIVDCSATGVFSTNLSSVKTSSSGVFSIASNGETMGSTIKRGSSSLTTATVDLVAGILTSPTTGTGGQMDGTVACFFLANTSSSFLKCSGFILSSRVAMKI